MRNWLVGGVLVFGLAIGQAAVPAGAHTASEVKCAVKGKDRVRVPDVKGKTLGQAIKAVKRRGLRVVGNGGGGDDLEAIVRAQEPPSAIRVPRGSCIGFRTTTAT